MFLSIVPEAGLEPANVLFQRQTAQPSSPSLEYDPRTGFEPISELYKSPASPSMLPGIMSRKGESNPPTSFIPRKRSNH